MPREKAEVKPDLVTLKNYLSRDVEKPPTLAEIREFLKSCTEEEKEEFYQIAAKELSA